MAGGPIFPHSVYPATVGLVWPMLYTGAGANSKHEFGLGVADATILTGDATWRLRFQMPPSLPTGTGKLQVMSLANATTGALKFNPKWVSVAAEESPSDATPVAEGTQTVTWSTSDNDQYKQTKVTLDADTLVGGEVVAMELVFEDSGTTLAVTSVHQVCIIWE